MPSTVYHYYFAGRVYDELGEDLKRKICADKKAFFLGAQGPDILFYLKDFKNTPKDNIGEDIHLNSDVKGFYTYAAEYSKKASKKALVPYLLGHLCHYALDSTVHSYIFAREGDVPAFYDKDAEKYPHIIFESNLDYLCIKNGLKKSTARFKSNRTLRISRKSRKTVGEFYSEMINGLYGFYLKPKMIARAVFLMRLLYRFVDDVTGLKFKLFRFVERKFKAPMLITAFMRPRKEIEGLDCLNLKNKPYPVCRNRSETSEKSFNELFEEAVKKGAEILKEFDSYLETGAAMDGTLFDRNYCGDYFEPEKI